jgi:hypothetical protein
MNFVRGYQEIIASLDTEAEIIRISEMRDTLIRIFAALRMKYAEVLELRQRLEAALSDSFCILGNPTDTEASALLANSILTGRAVNPGEERFLFFGALLSALLACFFVKTQGPAFTLCGGLLFSLFAGMAFSVGFIITGYWFDPLVPAAACGTGVIASFIWAMIARGRYNRRFRLAYGPFVSRFCLKGLIRAGQPLPSQVETARAAIIAIRCPDLVVTGYPETKAILDFQKKVSSLIKKASGTIIGTEGNLVTVCFGSPLERMFLGNDINPPELQAVEFVTRIAERPDCASWQFGLDTGNCVFAWASFSGYFALGIPIQRAKILSRITSRHKVRIIISEAISESLPDLPVKKLAIIKGDDGSAGEPFYKILLEGKGGNV